MFLFWCALLLPLLLPGGRPHVIPQRVLDDGKGWEAADGASSPHAGQCAGQAETIQRGCQQVQRGRLAAENSPVQSEWTIREVWWDEGCKMNDVQACKCWGFLRILGFWDMQLMLVSSGRFLFCSHYCVPDYRQQGGKAEEDCLKIDHRVIGYRSYVLNISIRT